MVYDSMYEQGNYRQIVVPTFLIPKALLLKFHCKVLHLNETKDPSSKEHADLPTLKPNSSKSAL